MTLPSLRSLLGAVVSAILTPGLVSLTLFSLLASIAYYLYAYQEVEPSPRVQIMMYFLWLTILGWYVQRRERVTGHRLDCTCRYFWLMVWPVTVPTYFFRSEGWRNAASRAFALYVIAVLPYACWITGAVAAEERYAAAEQDEPRDEYCPEGDDSDHPGGNPNGHAATGDSYGNDEGDDGYDDEGQGTPDDEEDDGYDEETQSIPV